jgi:hypothetical protein
MIARVEADARREACVKAMARETGEVLPFWEGIEKAANRALDAAIASGYVAVAGEK